MFLSELQKYNKYYSQWLFHDKKEKIGHFRHKIAIFANQLIHS